MDEELDFREAQKRLQFVNATVNLAADSFDRVRKDIAVLMALKD